MKKIKLYIAVSLDGFIARTDGSLDWLTEFPNPSGTDHGYKTLMESIDTVIMGGKTYHEVLNLSLDWPYKEKTTFIISHHDTNLTTSENVQFITENVIDTIEELKRQDGKDIWLVGGGQLISMLLNRDLVDEMQICYIPIILGEGIPLFPNQPKESRWELISNTAYDSGILKADFRRSENNPKFG